MVYLTHKAGEGKRVHIFTKGISTKRNVIAWLEFELAYSDVSVMNISHNTTEDEEDLLNSTAIDNYGYKKDAEHDFQPAHFVASVYLSYVHSEYNGFKYR